MGTAAPMRNRTGRYVARSAELLTGVANIYKVMAVTGWLALLGLRTGNSEAIMGTHERLRAFELDQWSSL